MNTGISLTVTLASGLSAGVIKKDYTDRYATKKESVQLYNAVTCLAACIVFLLWGGLGSLSWYTVGLGFLFGVVTAAQQIFHFKALEHGPLGYTQVILSLSTIIPALSGVLFFDETLAAAQIVGIVLMLGCFILSVEKREDEQKKANKKWFCWSFVVFLCTGMIGVLQKVHQNSSHKAELNGFLVVAFLTSFLYSLVMCFVLKRQKTPPTETEGDGDKKYGVITFLLVAFSGVCVAAQNKLSLYLAGVMDSAVFFPIVNGGGLVLMIVASLILFREKMQKRQWIGILLGIVSVVFLCNPFA